MQFRSLSLILIAALSARFALAQSDQSITQLDEVVVTASPLGGTLFEQAQPVNLLTGERLRFRLEPTLGETINKEPGVSSTGFAPGASRPVIRGLADDRVRTLQNGVNTQDISNVSPDHAITIDPLSIETVEIVRGPATLLYGPNTIGGVVNVIETRVPERRLEPGLFGLPLRGRLDGRLGTVDEARSGAGLLELGAGPIQFHLDGFKRETQDYHIPGHARSQRYRERAPREERDETRDVVPNSFTRSEGGAIGASFVWDQGYIGAAHSGYHSRYGTIAEPDVTIATEQRRWDVRGAVREPSRGIKEIRFKLGITDYAHTEFEGFAVGTVFDQQAFDGRLELVHEKLGPFEGAIGLQSQSIDFSATGAEAFLPQVDTHVHSVFVFEEATINGQWRVQFGGRYDRQTNDSDSAPGFTGLEREFDAFSGSAGIVYTPAPEWAVALTASYTQRPPTYVELFANGPHVATNAFEIGNADLGLEESFALDLTVRKKLGRVTGSASAFYYHFSDFITATPTGLLAEEEAEEGAEAEEGLPIFVYRATDAHFFGGELELTFHLIEPRAAELPAPTGKSKDAKAVATLGAPAQSQRLDLTLRTDYVYAQDQETDRSLPRITPFRAGAELVYAFDERFTARVEGQYSARQNRTAELELPTDSYFLLNAGLSYKVPIRGAELDFYVRATNLTDSEARLHTSFLKEFAPLPGRGILFGVRAEF
ncbi:MAG: TonB-dependent receptor [Verrucomicrobiota bacterium]|nr:TonB-dependent receptor [Verrucomicrobiota bacterium]